MWVKKVLVVVFLVVVVAVPALNKCQEHSQYLTDLIYNTTFHLSFSTPQKSYAPKYVDITNGHGELIEKDVTSEVTRDTKSPQCY